ncbi:MAG: ferritin [Alphaproteobacteria bacterium]|nr:ferritin [Alphaproteobacteria bacterium]
MGEVAQKISKVDKGELIKILQCAFAEEWLAYYQYWLGAKVAEGLERPKVEAEFKEHAAEELKHADWLADRIIQLGETPLLDPEEWKKQAKCKYEAPSNPDTKVLVEQNLIAERCAIARYQQICDMCQGKDYETFRISRKILKEELEHEQEMEDFQADFGYYK